MAPRPKKNAPIKKAYHHGDLRRALLEASIALVEDVGVEALSLREVARKAGVSSAAPYHHFANKAELLGAIAAGGFTGLAQAMDEAILKLPDADDPIDRLSAIGQAYVAFARSHPTEFRLMFRPGLVTVADLPAECDPMAAFVRLLDAVDRVTRVLPPNLIAPHALIVTSWSVVHGAAELLLDGPLGQVNHQLSIPIDEVGGMAVKTLTTLLRAATQSPRPLAG